MFDGSFERRLALCDLETGTFLRTYSLKAYWFSRFVGVRADRWLMLLSDGPREKDYVVLFDPERDEVVHTYDEREDWKLRAFSPDGRLAVRSKDAALEVYDPTNGEVRARVFVDHLVREALFTNDGQLLVGDQAGIVHLFALGAARERASSYLRYGG